MLEVLKVKNCQNHGLDPGSYGALFCWRKMRHYAIPELSWDCPLRRSAMFIDRVQPLDTTPPPVPVEQSRPEIHHKKNETFTITEPPHSP